MKKIKLGKLALNVETLRALPADELKQAVGGAYATLSQCAGSCAYHCSGSCYTCNCNSGNISCGPLSGCCQVAPRLCA